MNPLDVDVATKPAWLRLDVAAAEATGGHLPPGQVVLVDPDETFREAVTVKLQREGYNVTGFDRVAEAVRHLAGGGACDVVLLGWDAPSASGIEMLKALAGTPGGPPVVVLASRGGEFAEEQALDCAAHDFVSKSRNPAIIAKRVRLRAAEYRRVAAPAGSEERQRVGELELDMSTNRANWRGRQVPLTITQFRMVALLAQSAGRDVSYRELYDMVHGAEFFAGDGEDGYRTNVRSLIRSIRQHFRSVDDGFAEIENYPGFGYRWRTTGRRTAAIPARRPADTQETRA